MRNSWLTTELTYIKSAAFFESYTMIWKSETILSITPFLCRNMSNLFKELQLPPTGTGTPSIWTNGFLHKKTEFCIPKGFTAEKDNRTSPRNTAHGQETLGKMKQIWLWMNLDNRILENKKSKETNKKWKKPIKTKEPPQKQKRHKKAMLVALYEWKVSFENDIFAEATLYLVDECLIVCMGGWTVVFALVSK